MNGGKAGTRAEAVESVTEQLSKLDARSTLFLHDLGTLVIDIDGNRRVLGRSIDPAVGNGDHSQPDASGSASGVPVRRSMLR